MKTSKRFYAYFLTENGGVQYLNAAGRWTQNKADKKTFASKRAAHAFACRMGEDISASYDCDERAEAWQKTR